MLRFRTWRRNSWPNRSKAGTVNLEQFCTNLITREKVLWQYLGVNRAVEEDAPWKSPSAGLFHLAWKSRKCGRDSHFSHSPDGDEA
jgi:hypothetical protein